MKYTTILLDLDGTLLNTLEDLTDAINHVLDIYNQPLHTLDEVKKMVGNGLGKLAERAVSDSFDKNNFDAFFKEFVSYYNTHNLIKTGPYPKVLDTIKALDQKQVKLAIVTNKGQTASDSLLQDFFYPSVKVIIGDDGKRAHKPASDGVDEALRALGVKDKTKVLYVGDSEVDALTGINAGLDYILCTYGFRDMDVLEKYNPVAYIDSFDKLLEYV